MQSNQKNFIKHLERFLPDYPSLRDENFSYQIARRKEFDDLKLGPSEEVPDQPGVPLLSQELQARFISSNTPYKELLLFHGTGTGKCVLPETKISIEGGEMTIEHMYEKYSTGPECYDGEGIWRIPGKGGNGESVKVLSFDPDTFSHELFSVSNFYKQHINEHIREIILDDGKIIHATKAHKFFDGREWSNILTKGCFVGVVRFIDGGENYIHLSKVKFISEFMYKGWVYDIEVEKTHNYIGNGIMCHNTCTSSLIAENLKAHNPLPAIILVPNVELVESYELEVATRCTPPQTYISRLRKDEVLKLKQAIEIYLVDEEMRKKSEKSRQRLTNPQKLRLAKRRRKKVQKFMAEGNIPVEKIIAEISEKVVGDIRWRATEVDRERWNLPKTAIDLTRQNIINITTDRKEKGRLKKAVSQTYKIFTYDAFIKVIKNLNPDIIKERYSSRLIIIDEAHHFRIQPPKKKGEGIVTKAKYDIMHKFLHTVKDCRKILLTATPIWDDVTEISSLMNLILPMDKQLPHPKAFRKLFLKGGRLPDEHKIQLKEKLRGRVSFLRAMSTTADRTEIGVSAPWLEHVIVYPTPMSDFQYKYALQAKTEIIRTEKGNKREVAGLKARDAATFIIPQFDEDGNIVGSYGTTAFQTLAYKKKKDNNFDILNPKYQNPEIANFIRSNLPKVSAKFSTVVKAITTHPKQVFFIYSDLVASGGGGVINFGLVLELFGLKKTKTGETVDEKTRRYAIISGQPSTIHEGSKVTKFLKNVNRPDNRYGDRCQVIIGSRKASEGLTLKNVRQIHILSGWWNISSIDQALGRVFRVGSHAALKPEERTIKVFRHVAVKNKGEFHKGSPYDIYGDGLSDEVTQDIHVYQVAEEKEFQNVQIHRILKEAAWDCPLAYGRNVLKTDTQGSRECDYTDCNYRCDGYPDFLIDTTEGSGGGGNGTNVWKYSTGKTLKDTYNLFYSRDEVSEMIRKIKELFGSFFSLKFDWIGRYLDLHTQQEYFLLLKALDVIIGTRMPIKNRFGFINYLKEENNIIFLEDSISVFSCYPESNYTRNMLVTETTTFGDWLLSSKFIRDKSKVDKFCKVPEAAALQKIHYRTLIILLEESVKNPKPEPAHVVLNVLNKFYVTTKNGKIFHNMYTSNYTGPGFSETVVKRKGRIRSFNPNEGVWADTDSMPKTTDVAAAAASSSTSEQDMWKDNPYGVVGFMKARKHGPPQFSIFVHPEPGVKTSGKACGSWAIPELYALLRKVGYYPKSSSNPAIQRKLDESRETFKSRSKEELIQTIRAQHTLYPFMDNIEELTKEDLIRIIGIKGRSKSELCFIVKEWFEDKNLFFEF